MDLMLVGCSDKECYEDEQIMACTAEERKKTAEKEIKKRFKRSRKAEGKKRKSLCQKGKVALGGRRQKEGPAVIFIHLV